MPGRGLAGTSNAARTAGSRKRRHFEPILMKGTFRSATSCATVRTETLSSVASSWEVSSPSTAPPASCFADSLPLAFACMKGRTGCIWSKTGLFWALVLHKVLQENGLWISEKSLKILSDVNHWCRCLCEKSSRLGKRNKHASRRACVCFSFANTPPRRLCLGRGAGKQNAPAPGARA